MVKPMCIVDLLMVTGNRSVLLPVAAQPIGSLLTVFYWYLDRRLTSFDWSQVSIGDPHLPSGF